MATIGLDLGGTKILAVRVEDGRVVETAKASTPQKGGPGDVLDAMAGVVAKVDGSGGADPIGVGVPGPVRPGSGVLELAANLPGWTEAVDVAAELSARCGDRTVAVGNDVNVGTLAEHQLGAGQGVENLLGIFMGTGVGAGLILDGRLREGPRGLAGELGHSFVTFREFDRAAVGRGELEDYAGRRMMEVRARATHASGQPSELVEIAGSRRMKSSVWERALEAGDGVARSIVDDAADAMATAMANVIAIVDIELVVLGGGMADRLGRPFRAAVQERLDVRCFGGNSAPIRPAALGDEAGAVGAALLVDPRR